jgi:hypothetical protein
LAPTRRKTYYPEVSLIEAGHTFLGAREADGLVTPHQSHKKVRSPEFSAAASQPGLVRGPLETVLICEFPQWGVASPFSLSLFPLSYCLSLSLPNTFG